MCGKLKSNCHKKQQPHRNYAAENYAAENYAVENLEWRIR